MQRTRLLTIVCASASVLAGLIVAFAVASAPHEASAVNTTPTATALSPKPTPTGSNPVITIPLSFVRVGDAAAQNQWKAPHVNGIMQGVNAIWSQANIQFTWPQNPNFKNMPDTSGSNGDVRDVSGDAEIANTCHFVQINSRATPEKQKQFPIGLIRNFVDGSGAQTSTLGVTTVFHEVEMTPALLTPAVGGTPKVDTLKGKCVLISIKTKSNPVVLAHELGHVMCLNDLNSPGNLMHGTKAQANTQLNATQIAAARACTTYVQQNLQTPVGGVAEFASVTGRGLAADDRGGGAPLWVVAVMAFTTAGAVALTGVAGIVWAGRDR